jgi:hypothetical protein
MVALSRRLHFSNFSVLLRLPQSRCTSSSSRPSQLDPLVAEVLKEPKRPTSKPKLTDPVDPAKVNLPPIDQWQKYFPPVLGTYNRVSLRNPQTAARLAEAFVPNGSTGKVVIEAYAGGFIVSTSLGPVSHETGVFVNRTRPTYSGAAQFTEKQDIKADRYGGSRVLPRLSAGKSPSISLSSLSNQFMLD